MTAGDISGQDEDVGIHLRHLKSSEFEMQIAQHIQTCVTIRLISTNRVCIAALTEKTILAREPRRNRPSGKREFASRQRSTRAALVPGSTR